MEYLDHLEAKPPFTETDTYVSDGTGEEDIVFRNRFHTHAFRYVRVRGIDTTYLHTPISPLVSAQAIPISAVDLTKGATFECSDSRLNAIHDMVKYTLSCLTFNGYMVDCPHIERMGYGGDGNSSTMTLQTLWDVRDLYYNWLTAWSDAMETNGDLPYVAPAFRTGGGPYWSGFIVKAPWCTYLNYGDPILIYRHYDEMCRWLNFVESHCQDGILKPWPDTEKRGWFLGDWLAPEGVEIGGESVLHVSNCFLADCLQLMEKMAHLTGHDDDAPRFAAWRKELLTAIHNHFYHPQTHTYANGTPLDQCYALLQGVPPDSTTSEKVKKQLLKDIHDKYHDHMAVGLVGVPIFTEWCIREHQAELMATLLRQPDYPGYLNMINNGATTTWESWDCGREGKEDRSRVHNCYNGIGIWFYQAVAGIRPDPEHPGYQHFFIDPQPVEGVTWVKATQPTAYGTICVEIENGLLKVDIPEGTTATVLHGTPNERCLSGGKHIIKL
jgi:alpha-L-rhamnosidase